MIVVIVRLLNSSKPAVDRFTKHLGQMGRPFVGRDINHLFGKEEGVEAGQTITSGQQHRIFRRRHQLVDLRNHIRRFELAGQFDFAEDGTDGTDVRDVFPML